MSAPFRKPVHLNADDMAPAERFFASLGAVCTFVGMFALVAMFGGL